MESISTPRQSISILLVEIAEELNRMGEGKALNRAGHQERQVRALGETITEGDVTT